MPECHVSYILIVPFYVKLEDIEATKHMKNPVHVQCVRIKKYATQIKKTTTLFFHTCLKNGHCNMGFSLGLLGFCSWFQVDTLGTAVCRLLTHLFNFITLEVAV